MRKSILNMNRIIIITLLTLTFSTLLFAQKGYLKIECSIPGLNVFLDTTRLGTTPIEILKIEEGTYGIVITNPDKKKWLNMDWTDHIQIFSNDTTIVSPSFTRNIIVRSKPFDAEVYFNNKYIGNTPLYFPLKNSSSKKFLIKKEHFKPYVLNVDELESSTIDVNLEPRNNIHSQLQAFNIKKENSLKLNKKLSYSLMALSIGSGIASVYFKDKANKKYNQYLVSGNIRTMDQLFADSEKYDNYSNISFATFEATFLLSFYFLIKTIGD